MMRGVIRNISKAFEILIIVIIVTLILVLINKTKNNLTDIRQSYSQDFINILELSVVHSEDPEMGQELGKGIINYIDNIDGKVVEVYNEDYEVEVRFGDNSDVLDIQEYPDLLRVTQEEEFGNITIERNNTEVVYFKWIQTENMNRKLLLLYGVNSSYFNFSYISHILYVILILIFALVIKINFIDKSNLYIGIFNDAENRIMGEFSSNRYEFLDREGE